MTRKQVVAITFNGFQGAAATAVLLERHPETALWVSSAARIGNTLSRIDRRATEQVFVVGVGADNCPREELLAALGSLLRSKVRVTWFYPWDHLDWLKEELGAEAGFEFIGGDGSLLSKTVADALECRSKRTAEIVKLAQAAQDGGNDDDFLQKMVRAAALRYLKFEDAEVFPAVIRKIADPSLITEADRKHVIETAGFGDRVLLGRSKEMVNVREKIRKIGADPSFRVLILGETGTGKELVARLIHESSPRWRAPFVAVSCANFPRDLLESELFGHEKGAFTGAVAQKKGQFESADGGTLFLDEVGELAPPLQAKLLRVLQEKAFYRVGGTKEVRVDVRVLAATNRDLKRAVQEGGFREDLFYRLNDMSLRLPPLRERPEDIGLISRDILFRLAEERDADAPKLSAEQVRTLGAYRWPGNVRQLESVLKRAFVMEEWDIPKLIEEETVSAGGERPADIVPLAEHERRYVLGVYEKMGRNKTQTAEALGIAVNTLKKKLRDWKVE